MKFLLKKASSWDFDGKGIDKKFNPRTEKYDRYDTRSFSTAEEYNEKFKDNWFDKGINHTTIIINEEQCIQRVFPNDCNGCFVDIDSLEDLIEFKNLYGEIIIGNAISNKSIQEILIYDDYIE